jgi:hypothetical protein
LAVQGSNPVKQRLSKSRNLRRCEYTPLEGVTHRIRLRSTSFGGQVLTPERRSVALSGIADKVSVYEIS